MPSVALLPAVAFIVGTAGALVAGVAPPPWTLWVWPVAGWIGWCGDRCAGGRFAAAGARLTLAALCAGFASSGAVLAMHAKTEALHTPLRALLEREVGGFDIGEVSVPGRHEPMGVRAVLTQDAAPADGFTTLRVRVTELKLHDAWVRTVGGVILTVGGHPPPERVGTWRAGRAIETFATFRRPARYLNEGVRDFEHDLALDGTTLLGSVKSALLVDVRARGTAAQELAAGIRQRTRDRVQRRVGKHDAVAAAVVTAILIGDRAGLPDEVRLRLQAAGTYHVIAISGGNIAILAGVVLAVLMVCGVTGRPAAFATLLVLTAYALVVTAEPSVWRATLMAVLYLGARCLGHRSPPWQAMGVAALLVLGAQPLDVRAAGFLLTFGATAALIEVAARADAGRRWPAPLRWLAVSMTASAAVELALLPVSAYAFSRVTSAGLVLNLAAVPLMTVVQVSGLAAVLLDGIGSVSAAAGWMAYVAADALVSSARLVDAAPWLARRVPPPPVVLLVAYYAALCAALTCGRWTRRVGAIGLVVCAAAIASGLPASSSTAGRQDSLLRLTMFDVGQGEAMLVQFPDRSSLMVDAGGVPFGGGSFDVGTRVLAPALWARGIRRIDTLLLTHGDPDHVGGAAAIVDDFSPSSVWYGVPVPGHRALRNLLALAEEKGAAVLRRQAGETDDRNHVRLRVLHPPAPDWERQRVRNDDSVVLEVVHGNVAMLLLGDVGAGVERALVAHLTPAAVRILKVGHHGSRTSTSRELVDAWRPQLAIVSAGRGNTFGHPAADVLARLTESGTDVYRTDVDGQIAIDSDGDGVSVTTFRGRAARYGAAGPHSLR